MSKRIASIALIALGMGLSLCAQGVHEAEAVTEILHTFTGGADGIYPFAGLELGQNGVLYGATQNGGAAIACGSYGCGAVFELTPPPYVGAAWSESVIYAFPTNSYPLASPTVGPSGVLYGTTYYGGANGVGNVYELTPPSSAGGTWTEADLYDFSGAPGDPQNPAAELVIGKDGVLYGTVQYAGTSPNCAFGCGGVFSVTPPTSPGGTWTEQTIYTFNGDTDGAVPVTKLALGRNGELYGTTYYGGGSSTCTTYFAGAAGTGCGTVFELRPPALSGGNWTESVLYRFQGGADGGFPNAVVYHDGELYGTVTFGGDPKYCGGYGCGGVFRLSPSASSSGPWNERVIYSFTGAPNALYPAAGPVVADNGTIYGTTRDGGDAQSCPENPGCGVVFELRPPSAPGGDWNEKILHRFAADEAFTPTAGVIIGPHGNLFGTTLYGGNPAQYFPGGYGTVFEVKPNGASK